jgi:hypothetical protein
MTMYDRLISYLTQYDQRQSTKRFHNPYALALYFQAAEPLKGQEHPGAFAHGLRRVFSEGFPPRDRMAGWLDAGLTVSQMPVKLYGKVKP